MHLLKRFFSRFLKPAATDLLDAAAYNTHCARDLGISVSRIRLPSGEEVTLVETICEAEPESRMDTEYVEAKTFISSESGP